MNKICSRLFIVFFYSDLHSVRFILGLAELLWAIALWWPGDTFTCPTYIGMRHALPEKMWGLAFFLTSVVQFYTLLKGEYHTTPVRVFAVWNSGLWLFVCISMYLSVYPQSAVISAESALAAGACWLLLRTGYYVTGRRSSDYGKH